MLGRLANTVLPETLVIAAVCFFDMAWTVIAIRLGVARESNPVMGYLICHGIMLFIAIKLASFMVPLIGLELIRPHRPKLVVGALRMGIAAYAIIYVAGTMHVHGLI